MASYTVRFIFDGRLMQEQVSTSMPSAARTIIEARYPGCRVISVS